jgi:hypothetical protein
MVLTRLLFSASKLGLDRFADEGGDASATHQRLDTLKGFYR